MPIHPDDRDRYPPDWPEIRQRILVRAGNRCEQCGRQNGLLHLVTNGGAWCLLVRAADDHMLELWGAWRDYDGLPLPPETAEHYMRMLPGHFVRTVLTIAHLDHTPENCDPDNLRALCQRCHLRYDQAHHLESRRRRAREALEQAGQVTMRLGGDER